MSLEHYEGADDQHPKKTGERHPLPVRSMARRAVVSFLRPANSTAYTAGDVIGRDGGQSQVETATAAGTIAEPVEQVETLTVVATITTAGDAKVTITSEFFEEPLEVPVAVEENDDEDGVAAAIRAALGEVEAITDHYEVGGEDDEVVLTAKVAKANDDTLNIALDNDTCEGITPVADSDDTTAGVADGSGNALVTVTGADIAGSPLEIEVPVVAGDTASDWAAKVRAALGDVAAITSLYTVGGTTTSIALTRTIPAANDSTLNIALDNGTCAGITPAATSTNTTAGSLSSTNAGSALLEFAAIGNEGAHIMITEARLQLGTSSVPTGITSFRLHLYAAQPDAILDNAAWALSSSADKANYLGYIDLGVIALVGSVLFLQAVGVNKHLCLATGSTSLWGQLVTNGAGTIPSATPVQVTLLSIGL